MLLEKFKNKIKKIKNRTSFKYQIMKMKGSVLVNGAVGINQKTEILGNGTVIFKDCVSLGYYPSPYNKTTSIYIEARYASAKIEIGENVMISNNAAIIADKTSITIGRDTLIGPNFSCFDTHFHHIDPKKRRQGDYSCADVIIGENVFIGINVTILKGTIIGNNSVIGAGCTISGVIPANSIVSHSNQIEINSLNVQ
ncbi:acyltransferase [Vibrio navarrensis]|uniref:acyltransferase n=1 Tax=Vibrio navarrensis TaxID=29495 RepID=UPI00051CF889|nr:acyltransferase [Vibrio navarrensis]KGK17395.1 hypothetical protein EA25_13355 [Vibrio navarrensis]